MATRFHDRSMLCRFDCQSLEDAHHIFVHCPSFQHLRDEYSGSLISEVEGALTDSTLPTSALNHILRVATHLFRDDSSWPLHASRFYLGLLPPLLPTTVSYHTLSGMSHRLLTRIAHSCHRHAIRLAARIWGSVIRHHLSSSSKPVARRTSTRESVLCDAHLTLPPHLEYLLHI
ncbi:hypothetical protein V8E52_000108 [Russula decolorans]